MFDDNEFEHWCRESNISELGEQFISRIRRSAPARRVRSGGMNVPGQYPSKKMGFTLQAESHRNELVYLRRWDLKDHDVKEIWDQPVTIKLLYESKNGHKNGIGHTPDYLLLRGVYAEIVECKMEYRLLELAEEQPNRYVKDGETWRCPPGEQALLPYGIKYRIVSSKDINPVEARNMVFLEDFLRSQRLLVSEKSRITIVSTVSAQEGILLTDLIAFCTKAGVETDDIYATIVSGDIFVDLESVALSEPHAVPVFTSEQATLAPSARLAIAKCSGPIVIDLDIGSRVIWDNTPYQIANVTPERTWLKPDVGDSIPFEPAELQNLIKSGLLQSVPKPPASSFSNTVAEILSTTPLKLLKDAYARYQRLSPFLSRDDQTLDSVLPERTRRRLMRSFRDAEQIHGSGFVGLISNFNLEGRPPKEWPEEVQELLKHYSENVYETLKQKRKYAVYCEFKSACDAKNFYDVPCYKTFWKLLKKRPRHTQVLKRQGRVAAYKHEFYYWLEKNTPRHGDRPFEICHIDHTKLDVEILSSSTGENLGRPWVTFLVDAYSRRILALYLTFDEPSYRSCMMVLRECVRRWGRLPQIVVVDGGVEFHSTFFDVLTALYQMTKKTRPGKKPRFGTVVERVFGTANSEFIHNLLGNTQIMRGDIREVCREVDPKRHAVWTLSSLYKKLCEWAYEAYDRRPHWTLKQSPEDVFNNGLRLGGKRELRGVAYNDEFKIYTLPTTRKGTAKVNVPRGIKINNFYYWV